MGDWSFVELGDVADVTKLAGFEYTKHFEYKEDGEIIALRALNVRDGKLDLTDLKRIDREVSNALPRSKLFQDDILFTYVGANIGQFARIPEDDIFHLAPNICRVRASEQCYPRFLFYCFRDPRFQDDLSNFRHGSSQPTIPMKNIRKFEIPLPPIKKQKAIAEVLSSLDDKIDLLHKQNQTLEALAETLFDKWFIDADYTMKIGDLITLQNGYAFKSKDFNAIGSDRIIKIKNISGNIVDLENADFIARTVAEKVNEKFIIKSGDILFAMTGAEIGKMGIVPENSYSLMLNQRTGLLMEKFKGARFLAYLQLKSDLSLIHI